MDDLIADITQAFDLAAHPHVVNVRSVRRRDTADDEGCLTALGDGNSATLTSGGAPASDTPIVREDAASVAREECARLQGTVRVLRERIADMEVATAAAEAARRSCASGAQLVSGFPTAVDGSAFSSLAGASVVAVAVFTLWFTSTWIRTVR